MVTRDDTEITIRNIRFDFEFLKFIRKYKERIRDKRIRGDLTFYSNGVMYHIVLVFKAIATLPDGEANSEAIAERYLGFFGQSVAQPSLARSLRALSAVGLIKVIDNPFDKRMLNIKLTKEGANLQHLFIGSTKQYATIKEALLHYNRR